MSHLKGIDLMFRCIYLENRFPNKFGRINEEKGYNGDVVVNEKEDDSKDFE
jgi:hypothetical protein